MAVIASLLWNKNDAVAVELARRGVGIVAVLEARASAELVSRVGHAGGRVLNLMSGVTAERALELKAAAQDRARRVAEVLPAALATRAAADLDPNAVATVMLAPMAERLHTVMLGLEGLRTLHASHGVAAVLTNESEAMTSKAAILWARQNGVPSVTLSHGANLARHYGVSGSLFPDHYLLFGERSLESLVDDGFDRTRAHLTGNPAWDRFAALRPHRAALRDAACKTFGLRPDEPIVLFATTAPTPISSRGSANAFEATLRPFLRACKILRDSGMRFNILIKGREINGRAEPDRAGAIAQEEGVADHQWGYGEMAEYLFAADVLVTTESNAHIEAMIAATPAVIVWLPDAWLTGPGLAGGEGIPAVAYGDPAKLAEQIRRILEDRPYRDELLAAMATALPNYHVAGEGGSAVRVAEALLAIAPGARSSNGHTGLPAHTREAWRELSSPTSIAQKGLTAEYYHNPRVEMIAMFKHAPRVVLDVGCGSAATGAEIRRLYPDAFVNGVELNPEAAALGRPRIDRMISDNIETLEFEAYGIARGSIDTVLLPDVLEHLRNPWRALVRLRPYLTPDAQVIASIPNVRNLWLMTELVKGNWTYESEGLLDVTHLRFFTLREIAKLFAQTGYDVKYHSSILDGRAAQLEGPPTAEAFDIDTPRLRLIKMTPADVMELRTIQFLVYAVPAFAGTES